MPDNELRTDPATLRLHLGELTADEVRIAQAAIRYALSHNTDRLRDASTLDVADKGYQVGDFDPQVAASLTAQAPASFAERCAERDARMNAQAPNVSTLNVLETAYMTWPEDIRRKLSIHDLRRMAGWAPSTSVGEWKLDTSAGTPILTYKKCSVIEGEDARYVLSLLLKDASKRGEYNRGWNDCLRAITAQQGEGESK